MPDFELLPFLQKYSSTNVSQDQLPDAVLRGAMLYFSELQVAGREQILANIPNSEDELSFLLENILAMGMQTLMFDGDSSIMDFMDTVSLHHKIAFKKIMMLAVVSGIGLSVKEEWR